jgi:hypothetical protein
VEDLGWIDEVKGVFEFTKPKEWKVRESKIRYEIHKFEDARKQKIGRDEYLKVVGWCKEFIELCRMEVLGQKNNSLFKNIWISFHIGVAAIGLAEMLSIVFN